MKAIVVPPLSSQWWKTNRPVLLRSKDLENALVAYERAHAAMGTPPKSGAAIDATLAALHDVDVAAAKAVTDCNKVLKVGLKETIGTLKNYIRVVETERAHLLPLKQAVAKSFSDIEQKYLDLEEDATQRHLDADDVAARVKILKDKVVAWAQQGKDATAARPLRVEAGQLQTEATDGERDVTALNKQFLAIDAHLPAGYRETAESGRAKTASKKINDFINQAQGDLKVASSSLGAIQKILA